MLGFVVDALRAVCCTSGQGGSKADEAGPGP